MIEWLKWKLGIGWVYEGIETEVIRYPSPTPGCHRLREFECHYYRNTQTGEVRVTMDSHWL